MFTCDTPVTFEDSLFPVYNSFHFMFQVERWERQYLSSTGEGKPARYQRMLDLARWLKEHVPEEDSSAGPGTGLVHGDYRADNLVFHPTEVCILALQIAFICLRLYNLTLLCKITIYMFLYRIE
jgi:aminoglycoside phosphotransferase (APT) family kinase protein